MQSSAPDVSTKSARRNRWRNVWLRVHLWLGLALGFWLSVIGLTGAILVFFYELEEVVHPQLFTVVAQPGGESSYKPVSEILSAAETALPAGAKSGFAYYPRTNEGAYWLFYDVPAKNAPAGSTDTWQVFVNPYTAQVLGTWLIEMHDDWVPREFFMFVFGLHYALLMPWEAGSVVVGIITLLTLFSLGVGTYLWWPRSRWKRALTFKPNASSKRFVYDLHNLSGIYMLVVFLAVLISGIYFNLPNQFFWVVRQFSPETQNRYEIQSQTPDRSMQALGMDKIMHFIRTTYPEGRPDWLYMPVEPNAPYTICLNGVKSASNFADRRCVVMDQYTGRVLHVAASGAGTGGDTFVAWQWPLHSGQAFGLPGRILVLLSGLALPILFVTGVIRWLHKRRSAKFSEQRRSRARVNGVTH